MAKPPSKKREIVAAKVMTGLAQGYLEYEIDVERILKVELPNAFDAIPVAGLTQAAIAELPAGVKGAYLLFQDAVPVYAGKTDTRHGFRQRLGRHLETIQDRTGIDPTRVGFKAARIMVFSNFDVEAILIKEMRARGTGALPWNFSGFGSNDPGHRREGQKPAKFDLLFPVDLDRALGFLSPGDISVLEIVNLLKGKLPYYFRFETDPLPSGQSSPPTVGHADFRAAPKISVPSSPLTMREALKLILKVLPAGWYANVFPNRVILYKDPTTYRFTREVISA